MRRIKILVGKIGSLDERKILTAIINVTVTKEAIRKKHPLLYKKISQRTVSKLSCYATASPTSEWTIVSFVRRQITSRGHVIANYISRSRVLLFIYGQWFELQIR